MPEKPILNQTIREILKKYPETGQLIPGEGVYTGEIVLTGKEGEKRFAVFAASRNLTAEDGKKKVFSFREAVRELTKRNNRLDKNARYLSYNTDILKEIAAMDVNSVGGDYNSELIIPPVNFLIGGVFEGGSRVVALYDLRNIGAVKGTLTTTESSDGTHRQLSSTIVRDGSYKVSEDPASDATYRLNEAVAVSQLSYANFSTGGIHQTEYSEYDEGFRMSVRPYWLRSLGRLVA